MGSVCQAVSDGCVRVADWAKSDAGREDGELGLRVVEWEWSSVETQGFRNEVWR